jgi:uncharacterized membrane protein
MVFATLFQGRFDIFDNILLSVLITAIYLTKSYVLIGQHFWLYFKVRWFDIIGLYYKNYFLNNAFFRIAEFLSLSL